LKSGRGAAVIQVGSRMPFSKKQVKALLTLEPTEKQTYPRKFSNSNTASVLESKAQQLKTETKPETSNF